MSGCGAAFLGVVQPYSGLGRRETIAKLYRMLKSVLKPGKGYSLEANSFSRYVSVFHIEAEPRGAVVLRESLTFSSRFLLFL